MSATAEDLIAAINRALARGGRFWVDQSTRMRGDRFVCGECGKQWPTILIGPPFEHQRCGFWNPGCNGLITAIWDGVPRQTRRPHPCRRKETRVSQIPPIDPDHPEAWCRRCARSNVTWSAPSPLWNQVMRGGDINGDEIHDGIVCPTCFAQLAEEAGIAQFWRLDAQQVHAELQTITPSGRIWNPATWLWQDAPKWTTHCPTCETEITSAYLSFGGRRVHPEWRYEPCGHKSAEGPVGYTTSGTPFTAPKQAEVIA